MKKLLTVGLLMTLLMSLVGAYVFPSTNEDNKLNGDPYVELVSAGAGQVTLEFVNPHGYWVCFEYRTDGDTSQATGDPNYNTAISDLYPYLCLNDDTQQETFNASGYVEVRSVFGAERDHDFDWTRFDVLKENRVPEFGLIGTLMALGLVGLFVYTRR